MVVIEKSCFHLINSLKHFERSIGTVLLKDSRKT